ncbi:catecholate siderophore receptor [Silvibacterium bohemicum]|uniref:Catecholate siderophore receptor n=1 Tax=Silvibacterium bohemicum TaxID=1577686 RepID=A0A841JX35_9BACT|nr:TonB-dependent siderophore receptor [Silvibacterium bohemicum]MBB6145973.1 catecholate siderophore receptor [Silvibacterium bohemicum]
MKQKKRRYLTGHRAWLAMGTIAAYAAAGPSKATIAYAKNSKSQSGNQAQLTVRRYDISAGPLDLALAQFSKASGIKVAYTVPAETIPGFKSHGVSGLYSDAQALRQLLAGTGLDFTLQGQDAVSIGVKNAESVQVTASSFDSIGLSKFPAPLIDTPQAINTIPAQLLADQGVSTLRDTLRNSPGISLAAGEGALQGDNLTIRGFSAQDDIFLDGVRDFGSYYRDPFNYEKVDVLEGPAGVEFGRGSTGGVINQESKVPQLHPFMRFDGGLGTDMTRRFTGDINQPLPGIAAGAAARLNFMVHDSGVAQRDVTESRRFGVAPTFALGLNTPTRLVASELHSQADDIPDYGIPWYFGHGAPVPRHNYYGFADHNFLRTNVDVANLRVEHDLGSLGLLRNVTRYAHYERKWQITEPQVNNASAGAITPATPLSQVMVNRNQIAGNSDEAQLWDQAETMVSGKLLGIRQTAVLGAEGGRESSDPIRVRFTNPAGINTVPLTSLLHPDPYQPFSGTVYPNTTVHTTAFSAAAYMLDTFELGRQWELSGGIRFDHFDANYRAITNTFSATTGGDTVAYPKYEQDLNKGSWRAALVYKPRPNGSIYFDYGTSFDPSAETLSLSAANAAVPPEENETYELGSKWDLNGGRLTARGALFRTNRENVLEPDPTDSSVDVLAGNQRVDGAEGVIQGRLTDRWELLTSYTFMHSEVVSSNFYPLSIGLPLQNVPQNLFNLWTEYRLPRGFEVGAGSNFVGARDANSTTLTSPTTAIEKAPEYWTFNAMVKYDVTERIALQANINNLLDRFFLDELHPGHVIPGAGTSALFGAKFKF